MGASRFLTKQAVAALSLTCLLLVGAAGTVGGAPGSSVSNTAVPWLSSSSSSPIWFDDVADLADLTNAHIEQLVRFSAAGLRPAGTARTFPAAFRDDTQPRIVFLSVSDGKRRAQVVMGTGNGLQEALEQAMSQARQRFTQYHRLTWMKLDIVESVLPMQRINLKNPLPGDRSLQGLAFDRTSGIALLPEEVVANSLVNTDRKLQLKRTLNYVKRRAIKAAQRKRVRQLDYLPVYRFSTLSVFFDTQEKKVVRLYRGHRSFQSPGPAELLTAARWGGEYLAQAVDNKGKFMYAYLPKSDRKKNAYNILRHAGSVYSMLELYEVTRDTELLEAAQRGIRYLVRQIHTYQVGLDRFACVVEKGYVKLGGNALAILALAKYTDVTQDAQYVPLAFQLGRWIQQAQRDDGEFFIHKQRYPLGTIVDFSSAYYPGEAILALDRLQVLDPQGGWIETAEKAAHYLITIRDGTLATDKLSHDHWLLYGLNELYRARPKAIYFDHAMRIAEAITQHQNRDPRYPDWFGSYYRPPRSTPTATRSEGLCAAYLLARDFGQPDQATRILDAVKHGVTFQLQTQFRPESALYVRDPRRTLGGFRNSLTNFEIRIDYVQHNISSLLGLHRILDQRRALAQQGASH